MEHTEGFGGPLKARDRTVRIFRNSPAIRYKGRVHEFIRKHDRFTQSLHLDESALVIRHTGYSQEKRPGKLVRNHLLLEESLKDGSADGLTYYYLGHSFWTLGQYDKAVEFAAKAIEDGMVASSMFAHRVYCVLIESLLHQDGCRQEDVEPYVAAAMERYPHHPEVLKCRGNYLRRFGLYTEAREALLASLAANERYGDSSLANEFLFGIAQVHGGIADLYDLMNDPVKALEHYVAAVKLKKDEAGAFDGLVSLVRPQKAADIAGLINSLYDLATEEDVGFVVTRLAALRERKVFPYYEKVWAERFGHKDFTATKFLLSGHCAQAEPLFAAAYRESGDRGAEIMAAVAFLCGGWPPGTDLPGRQTDTALRRIVAAFFRPGAGRLLTPEDFPSYLELLKNYLHVGDVADLGRLLAISLMFPVAAAAAQTADLLTERKMYRQALDMYTSHIGRTGAGPGGELYCRAGFCCYRLKDYGAAGNFFAQALASGFRGPEAGEYLAWAYRQCKDEGIRDKLAAVRSRYGLDG